MQETHIAGDKGAPRNRRYVYLGILCLFMILHQADRAIMSVAGEAVKVDLKLTDSQIGWLGGLAYSIVYSTLAIPIARLADRFDRWRIISVCLLIWTGMTASCAAATTFIHLFLARMGVGMGEAGCSPCSQSLVSDYFDGKQRASALSLLFASISVGGLIGASGGGWMVQHHGWQAAFVVMALPGVLLGLACLIGMKDAYRGKRATAVAEPEQVPGLGEVLRVMTGSKALVHMVIGATIVMVGLYSLIQFSVPYFVRLHALSYSQAGILYGLIFGLLAAVGAVAGGLICDGLKNWGQARYPLVAAVGMFLAAPLYMAGFLQPKVLPLAILLGLAAACHSAILGPTFAFVHEIVTTRMRATATALVFLTIGLIGGVGPLLTGMLVDWRAQSLFSAAHGGIFALDCPGGRAPVGAVEGLSQNCASALTTATRDAIIATCVLFIWSGAHYAYAAIRLRRDALNRS